MSAVKAVVMDKTGTITEGNFEVQQIIPAKESRMTADELLYLCAVCEQNSTHPIAASIVAAARKQGGSLEENRKVWKRLPVTASGQCSGNSRFCAATES